jgi:hypothetical protein
MPPERAGAPAIRVPGGTSGAARNADVSTATTPSTGPAAPPEPRTIAPFRRFATVLSGEAQTGVAAGSSEARGCGTGQPGGKVPSSATEYPAG